MLDIRTINWRQDMITDRYVKENCDLLAEPKKMTAGELGCACTYCETIENPYSYEIMYRSGHLAEFREEFDVRLRRKIFDRACRYHGIMVC